MTNLAVFEATERIVERAGDLERTAPDLDLAAVLAPTIDLDDYGSLFGFGDSIGDSGNAAAAIDAAGGLVDDQTPSALGYFENRFSNGPNYFDQLHAAITGADVADYTISSDVFNSLFDPPDLDGGVNFALGGATAIPEFGFDGPDIVDGFAPDFDFQVGLLDSAIRGGAFEGVLEFIDDVFGIEVDLPRIPQDALFVTNFGGNDILEFRDLNPELEFTAAEIDAFAALFVGAYRDNLVDLIGLGARNFLVASAPNSGVAPDVVGDLFPGDVETSLATFQPVVDGVNAALVEMLADLAFAYPETTIFFFDADIAPIIDDPEAFGFDPALLSTPFIDDFQAEGSTVTLDDLPRYAFIDDFHPTAAGQDFIFEQALTARQVGTTVETLIAGTDGDDALAGGDGRETLNGRAGDDALSGGGGEDVLFGGRGDDDLDGGARADLLVGANGDDVLSGGGGDDAVSGGAGADLVRGGGGDDVVNGGRDADRIFGQKGDDILDGDAGDDRLFGGDGADVFVFTGQGGAQRDVIVDFTAGEDLIDLSRLDGEGVAASDLDAILERSFETEVATVLRLTETDRLALRGVELETIAEDFFIFAG